ncbi:MAG: alpha/beta hydrolase [Candidatus Methanoplasma sp.]|jgi:pimeloyl-ACP methyl ester carboxylesterase|nr:alpha/beta hydrolase [Candidatus Methanoplasma sp.]
MKICVNGIEIHYEVYGTGPPIILLHGNGESMEIFDRLAEDLCSGHTVFLIDTRGHGESQGMDSFCYADIAEDVAAFITSLNICRPILYGFSDGGIAGLMLASKYPDMLAGLIVSGANLTPKDLKLGFRIYLRLMYRIKRDPLLKLMLDEPNITESDLRRISVPTLVTAGEKDIVRVSHAEYIADTVQNGRLTVAKDEDHSSYIVNSEKLYPMISGFLAEIIGWPPETPTEENIGVSEGRRGVRP